MAWRIAGQGRVTVSLRRSIMMNRGVGIWNGEFVRGNLRAEFAASNDREGLSGTGPFEQNKGFRCPNQRARGAMGAEIAKTPRQTVPGRNIIA